jgi:hypothetical protein
MRIKQLKHVFFVCQVGGTAIMTCATSYVTDHVINALRCLSYLMTKRYLSQIICHRCATNLAHKKGESKKRMF